MSLRVTQYGEPILRKQGKPVTQFNAELKALSKAMLDTMYDEEGVGLAAQQIGKALMICVVDIGHLPPAELDYEIDGRKPPLDLIMPMVIVNPQVELLPSKAVSGEEGCLSFPGVRAEITRPDSIKMDYQDVLGNAHTMVAKGWFARVIQHEVDHLNGRLFIDHLDTRSLRNLDAKLKKLKRQAKAFISKT